MRKVSALLCFCLIVAFQRGMGQCPVTDFTVAPTSCQNQTLQLTNGSAPGSTVWDFCSGDLNNTPTAQFGYTLTGADGRPTIEFVFDTKWHAFVTGTFSTRLYHLEFDNGLQSAPTATTNMGNPGGLLNQPGQIRVIQEGGLWYGILHNTTGELIKLSFGSQLTNAPTATSLMTGVGYINSGLALGKDPVHGWVCVLSTPPPGNQFMMIRLGNSLSIPNPVTDVVTSGAVPNPNSLGDVDVINVCGNWVGFADNLGDDNLYRLDFGASLFASPTITQLSAIGADNPGRLRLTREGEDYFLFVMALDGTLSKLNFGTSITSAPAITHEGTIGGVLPGGMYGLGLAKENSVWTILGISAINGQVFNIHYPDLCSATPKVSAAANPTVSYSVPGTYQIALQNSSAGVTGAKTRSVTVSVLQAPDIDFTSLNNCALNNVVFNSVNVSGNINTYAWNFGDTQTSSAANPTHVYSTAGTFAARLTVTASNGCLNTTEKSLTMYNAPVSDFTLPSASPICTNQNYTFLNTSSFDVASNPAWEWRLNGALIATTPDLTTPFSTATSQELRLKAIIPGCTNEMTKIIGTVLTGPLVDFSMNDDCSGVAVNFSNSSSGVDAGYSWSFGDGSPTSGTASPAHAYSNPGVFQVTLTGNNLAGCQNQTTKPIQIYSVPQPDFSVGLPPFSCSNTPTPFQNTTPPLTDSNITHWAWAFGDPMGSTSGSQNPSFTYTSGGSFSVDLTATSDFGCFKTVNKVISIGASPVADFVLGPSCLNKPTSFTDVSSGGIQSRFWQIGPATFTTTNPVYTFTSTGSFSASLTVTAVGGCTGVKSVPIDVPVPPSQSFTTTNPCAGQASVFTDATPSMADAITGWNWNADGNAISGNPAQYEFPTSGTFNVKMTTTHASGCVYTLSNNISIHPSPIADFVASPDRGAAPLVVQFQNQSQQATQYTWLFNDKVPSASNVASPIYTFTDLGDYSAQLTATNSFGCADVKSVPILVLVPVVDLQLTDFYLDHDPATGNLKAFVSIYNNSNVTIATTEVALFLSEKAVVNELVTLNLKPGESTLRSLSFSISPTQTDMTFICANVLSQQDVSPDNNKRCISMSDMDVVFNPYPNPSSGTLQIDWIADVAGTTSITVYNGTGQVQYAWGTACQPGLNQSVHDLAFLAAGIYLVTVRTSVMTKTMRFVRQ